VVKELFENKTIAIIGSSPTILDHEYGAAIDAHDVVMRINLHGIHGRPECLGSRTDVRYIGARLDESYQPAIYEIIENETLILKAYNAWIEQGIHVPVYYSGFKMYKYFEKLPSNLLDGINRYKHTTSGTNAIAIALDNGAACVNLYGFSMETSKRWYSMNQNGETVKYNPAQLRRCHCEPDQEIEILNRVMQHCPVRVGC